VVVAVAALPGLGALAAFVFVAPFLPAGFVGLPLPRFAAPLVVAALVEAGLAAFALAAFGMASWRLAGDADVFAPGVIAPVLMLIVVGASGVAVASAFSEISGVAVAVVLVVSLVSVVMADSPFRGWAISETPCKDRGGCQLKSRNEVVLHKVRGRA
jgi:hypothetical protein